MSAILVLGLFFFFLATAFWPESSKDTEAEVLLRGAEFSVDIVRGPLERSRGLSGRDSLPEFGGMLFQFEKPGVYSFWMKGMHFSIDIIWLKDGKVVHIVKNAPEPVDRAADSELPVYSPLAEADKVLEIQAGMAERLGVSLGDDAVIILKE